MNNSPEYARLASQPSLITIEDIGRKLLKRASHNKRSFGLTDTSDMFGYNNGFQLTEAYWEFHRDREKPVANRLRVVSGTKSISLELIKESDINSPYKPHRVISKRLSITSNNSFLLFSSGPSTKAMNQDHAYSLKPPEAVSEQLIGGFRQRLLGFISMAEIMLEIPDEPFDSPLNHH